ncbi:TonB-dependent receptor, partial [marine sediment metagenome]
GFCSQIDRDENNDVEVVRSGFINASALKTSGVEFQVRYTTELGDFGSTWGATFKPSR